MKVIVAGATGLVGKHIVAECIANESITHAYVLTRRTLDLPSNPKLTVILHDDFTDYPPSLLEQVSDAGACLWAIGGRVFQFPSVEACRHANVTCTLAAARAFKGLGSQFRFVFCSGSFTEHDQEARLLFLNDSRKIKGQVETELFALQDDSFKTWCVRPSGILDTNAGAAQRLTGILFAAIGADVVARGMINVALRGYERPIVTNGELKTLGSAR